MGINLSASPTPHSLLPIYSKDLAVSAIAPYTLPLNHICNSIDNLIMKGVFRPLSTSVRVRFDVSGYTNGQTQFRFDLGYSKDVTPGAVLCARTAAGMGAMPGKTALASMIAPQTTSGRETILTGLTPGADYTWELHLLDSTYANHHPVTAPTYIEVLDVILAGNNFPAHRYVAVTGGAGSTALNVIEVATNNTQRSRTDVKLAYTLPLSGYHPKFTPDGKYLHVPCTNLAGTQVVQISTADWSIVRTITVGGATTNGTDLFNSADSSTVYLPVSESGAFKLYPITVSSGAVGTAITTGALGGRGKRHPANTRYIYFSQNGNNRVGILDTQTNTIVATFVVGTGPAGLYFTPNGSRLWVANSSAGTMTEYDTTTPGVAAAATGRSVTVSTAMKGVVVTPDGLGLVALSTSAYWWFDLATLTTFDHGVIPTTTAGDFVQTADGSLFFTRNAENEVYCWPGGSLYIDTPNSGVIRGSYCELMVEGAIAGTND